MAKSSNLPSKGAGTKLYRLHSFFGFSKGYNFVLWFIFAGALFGFTLARLMYLDIPGVFCGPDSGSNHAAPGECHYYQTYDRYKIGIRIHLYTILPAGLLVVLQFVPAVRYKAILFHRMNGYIIILLAVIANVGALMIAREAFGGSLATQAWVGLLAILTFVGLGLAYYNIKRLQIDQHRAWMIRTWFYFSCIITLRIIMIIAAQILTSLGDFYSLQPCEKLLNIAGSATRLLQEYPSCAPFTDGGATTFAIVHVDFGGTPSELMAAMNECFGMAGWLALAIHAFGVEVYLHLTPEESKRLRQVSYERQVEAGHKHPGDSGWVSQPFRNIQDQQEIAPLGKDERARVESLSS